MIDLTENCPPSDLNAEAAVIASCLLDPAAVSRARSIVSSRHFYGTHHRHAFEAIEAVQTAHGRVDAVLLEAHLRDAQLLQAVGGREWLLRAVDEVPTAANVEHYARAVRAKARLRAMIQSGQGLVRACYGLTENDPETDAARFASEIMRFLADKLKVTCESMATLAIAEAERLANPATIEKGLSSGFRGLDHVIGSFRPGELIIVAGRPSMGKTALCTSMAHRIAMGIPPRRVLFMSAEMSKQQLTQNMIAQIGRVNTRHIQSGQLSDEDYRRSQEAAQALHERAPIDIDDRSGPSVATIRALAEEKRPAIVMIDYLTLIDEPLLGKNDRDDSRWGRVAEGLKNLAKDQRIPVLALAQLNRNVTGRAGNKPELSDLRSSGEIEHHADMILFPHRPEYYEPEKMELRGKAQILVRKNRNGAVGEVPMTWDAATVRFEDVPLGGSSL